jgi:hypothetical protein
MLRSCKGLQPRTDDGSRRMRERGNTRDETRTRKAVRPGDFESPASTDSATRARVESI